MQDHIAIEGPIHQVYLWGMMGVGKSTLGQKLARRLDWGFVDLDDRIEASAGQSITKVFKDKGEAGFRSLERDTLRGLKDHRRTVVAVGGGTPAAFDNGPFMLKRGLCVWLDAPVGMLVHRLRHAKHDRPLVAGLSEEDLIKRVQELVAVRSEHYAKAHMILSMNNIPQANAIDLLASIIQGRSQDLAQ